MMRTDIEGPLLRPKAAAEYLGISKAHLYKMIGANRFPAPLKISNQAVGFPKAWLDDFIATREQTKIGEFRG